MNAARLRKFRAAAEREARRRAETGNADLLSRVTAESLAGDHAKQLAMILDPALYMIVLCSRRAGKTHGLAVLALLTALRRPRQNILYIGLSKPHARKFLWNEVWCPLLDGLKIPHKRLEDEMTTTFPNGSIVYVSGTDDVRHIESFLGNRLDLAIVDEAQGQSDSVLIPLTTRILPNALLDDMDRPGKLVMAGTIPEVNAGRFMDVWNAKAWSPHNWSRFENPHLKNQAAALAAYLRANPGLTEESPEVQREWHGRFAFDSSATAYGYSASRNGYLALEPAWLDTALAEIVGEVARRYPDRADLLRLYRRTDTDATGVRFGIMAAEARVGVEIISCAIDQGRGDRFSVELTGWGRTLPRVQHLFEFSTPRNVALTLGQAAPVLRIIARHYRVPWWHMDGVQNELDTFGMDYGIPAIKAPNKQDAPGQIKRTKDLLQRNAFDVMIGSAMEQDFVKARRDLEAAGKNPGAWKWASSWHPDPSEAGRYSLGPYWDSYQEPDIRSREEKTREAFQSEDVFDEDEPEPDQLSRALNWR